MRMYFKISIYLLLLSLLTMPKENRRRFYTSGEVTKMLFQEDEIAALECLTEDIENRQAVGKTTLLLLLHTILKILVKVIALN